MKNGARGIRWFVILDHDKKEFCIKGPMVAEDVGPWMEAVRLATEQGRNIYSYCECDKDRNYITSWIEEHHSYPETLIFDL